MREIGGRIKFMVLQLSLDVMAGNTSETMRTTKNVAMECSNGPMVAVTRDIGEMISNMVAAFLSIKMASEL